MSNIAVGAAIAADALTAIAELTAVAMKWNQIIATAHAEGREISDAELKQFQDDADQADATLAAAIAARKNNNP